MSPDPVNVAYFLTGCAVGAFGVFLLSGLALWFLEVSRAVREGSEAGPTLNPEA